MAKTSSRHPQSLAAAALFIIAASVIPGYTSSAQEIHRSMDHAVGAEPSGSLRPRAVSAAPETLRVLVARADFIPDTEPRTTGTGRFDVTQPTRPVIDPPPHDVEYARQHITFLENYYRKSSGGKLIVVGTVLDDLYHLPYTMAHYSPPRSSPNNAELGALVTDVWHTVDSVTPGVQFQNYQAFMIFHAGVGRDIDLASQLGYDPGPFDIPSVYLNIASLRKIFGAGYDGVAVQGGSFHITNSLVIPETESRLISTGIGSALLQLGINGLIAASIGSHIGLPDLFNTRNGRTGIGRFGLMDGQSIFSWSGIFPPEPSAWEKYFLGWISPIVAGAGTVTYSLPASAVSASADSVLRVPISGKEYFLVENRNRDANRDGSTATVVRNGLTVQQTYMRDTADYNAYDPDSLYGVVIDVDEFDWSLPGITTNDGVLYDGGILIWHIDENVIDANIEADAVNANANRRGVNLMEADGSQDIGQSYDLLHPGFGSEDGTYLDYWYHGNVSTPRTNLNEFTPNSAPNSLSNDFGNSHVYIREFADRGPRMSVTVRIGDEQIAPLPGFPKNLLSSPGMSSVLPADLDGDGVSEFVVGVTGRKAYADSIPLTDGAILAFRQNGTSFYPAPDSSGTFIHEVSNSYDPPVAINFNGDGRDDIATVRHPTAPGYTGADLRIFSPLDADFNALPDVLWGTQYTIASSAAILPFAVTAGDSAVVWGGTGRHLLLLNDTTQVHSSGSNYSALAWEGTGTNFYGYDAYHAIEKFSVPPAPVAGSVFPSELSGSPALADLDGDGRIWLTALSRDGSVYVVDTSFRARDKFPFSVGSAISSSPSIGDLNGDGRKDIVFTAGPKVYALNSAAASLDNFPLTVRTSFPINSSPVLADVDGDGKVDILVVTQEGRFFAYNAQGKILPGFPLQIGGNVLTSVTVFRTTAGNVGIAAAAEDHYIYAWETSARYDSTPHPWPMYLHDARHSGFEDLSPRVTAAGSDFLPAPRAYNWPNPVTSADGFKTHIRYYVTQDARVTVKIFDMAGDLVTELSGNGVGGLDNELVWDVAAIQSGVYFGHIEAEGTGANGHAVIKIAVVK